MDDCVLMFGSHSRHHRDERWHDMTSDQSQVFSLEPVTRIGPVSLESERLLVFPSPHK